MPYYPDVRKGQAVKHSTALENDVRRMVNSTSGFGDRSKRGLAVSPAKIKVWNASGSIITNGTAVHIKTGAQIVNNELIPVEHYSDYSKPFFVTTKAIEARGIGEAVTAGALIVYASGTPSGWVRPYRGAFLYCEESYDGEKAKVLSVHGQKSEYPVIMLNGGSAATPNAGNGESVPESVFSMRPLGLSTAGLANSVRVNSGWANVNGVFHAIQPTEVILDVLQETPQKRAYVCVHSEPRPAGGGWTTPEIVLRTDITQYEYPIGLVWWSGVQYLCDSYNTPIAIILESAECACEVASDG